MFELELFEGEIAFDDLEFVRECDLVPAASFEGVAQEFGEAEEHFAGAASIFGDEGAEVIEAVEEEVRIDLRLEGAEFGFVDAGLQAEALQLAIAVAEEVLEGGVDEAPQCEQE